MNFINNYIYFYSVEKFCVLPTYPDSINDTMTSTFAQTDALSRSAPVFTYQHSGPRQVQITLQLHRDMMNDLNRDVSNLKSNVVDFRNDDYVDTLIKYLQSIALPKYNVYASGSKSVIPPMVAVRFGNELFVKGVVNGAVSVTYKKPILVGDKYAQVEITFPIVEIDPYDALTVIQDGSFRGLTKTFKNGIFADDFSGYSYLLSTNKMTSTKTTLSDSIKIDKNSKPFKKYTQNASRGA